MLRLIALFCLIALPAKAEEIVLGLSKDEVAITATFDGSDLLIFGAISRDGSPTREGDLGVIVTVAGPDQPVVVRRKEKRFGIWVNVEAVDIDVAPSFYAVATNAPLGDILNDAEDVNTRITIPRAIRSVDTGFESAEDFSQALIRIRAGKDLYQMREGAVDVEQDTLFRTEIQLPANLTEGDYATEIYLTRGGEIVDLYSTVIPVKKVGLERWLYNLAHEAPFWYGIMSLAIAIGAGWVASAAFSVFRR